MANLQQLKTTILVLSITLLLLSGCQLNKKYDNSSTSYGQYYLTLQQLSQQQLAEEITKQQKSVESQEEKIIQVDFDAQIKLLLLYSLPKSPIYNSFIAKSLLNKLNSKKKIPHSLILSQVNKLFSLYYAIN
ncbi:MAG: hypothetical protein ACI89T_001614 [Cognaticolwellia sp.]|jgi:hypothetical protein